MRNDRKCYEVLANKGWNILSLSTELWLESWQVTQCFSRCPPDHLLSGRLFHSLLAQPKLQARAVQGVFQWPLKMVEIFSDNMSLAIIHCDWGNPNLFLDLPITKGWLMSANRPVSQIPQCTCPIPLGPSKTEMCTFHCHIDTRIGQCSSLIIYGNQQRVAYEQWVIFRTCFLWAVTAVCSWRIDVMLTLEGIHNWPFVK